MMWLGILGGVIREGGETEGGYTEICGFYGKTNLLLIVYYESLNSSLNISGSFLILEPLVVIFDGTNLFSSAFLNNKGDKDCCGYSIMLTSIAGML